MAQLWWTRAAPGPGSAMGRSLGISVSLGIFAKGFSMPIQRTFLPLLSFLLYAALVVSRNGQAPAAAGVVGLAGGADVLAAAIAAVAAAEEQGRQDRADEPRLQGHPG